MPVVINEFEMLSEPAPAAQPAREAPEERGGATPLEPVQLAPALGRLQERALRVWAH